MTPSLTPSVSYIYYSNTEYDVAAEGIFLDNNVYVKKNPSTDLVNDVFSTPGDVLITGSVIYQGDSIYAQASADPAYAPPLFGTSTRNLNITDNAANTIFNSTTPYTTYNINTTFSIVGGRNYFVRGRTDFAWPAAADLTFGGIFVTALGFYKFVFNLTTAVDGDFTIDAPFGIQANMYIGGGCSGFPATQFGNSAAVTVTRGQYGYGELLTGEPEVPAIESYNLINSVYIEGSEYFDGDVFQRGVTTVSVNIVTNCQPI